MTSVEKDAETMKTRHSQMGTDVSSSSPNSASGDQESVPSGWRMKIHRKSSRSASVSSEDHLEEPEPSLPRRLFRRASLKLQETMDAAADAAVAYATGAEADMKFYKTPEERCMNYELTGGDLY